jgi:hypothetical protein
MKNLETQLNESKWTTLTRDQAMELQRSGVKVEVRIARHSTEAAAAIYTSLGKMPGESIVYTYDNGYHISINSTDYHRIFGIFKEDTKTTKDQSPRGPEATRGPEAPAQPASPQGPEAPEPRVKLTHEECLDLFHNHIQYNPQVALSPTGELIAAKWINWPHMYEIMEEYTPHLYMEAGEYSQIKRQANSQTNLELALAKQEILETLKRYEDSLNKVKLGNKIFNLCCEIEAMLAD